MAIRSVAIPWLSGGAVLLGLAAFSWLQNKRRAAESTGPTTLREAGLDQQTAALEAEEGPLSRRGAAVSQTLELDLDFADSPRAAHGAQRSSHMRDELGAHFLARATDALSPFGDAFASRQFDPDQYSYESGRLREAPVKVANGEESLEQRGHKDEIVTESERRPSATRSGARK